MKNLIEDTEELLNKTSEKQLITIKKTNRLAGELSEYYNELIKAGIVNRFQEIYFTEFPVTSDKICNKALFLKVLLTQDEILWEEILNKTKLKSSPVDKFFFKSKKTILNTPLLLTLIQKALAEENEKELLLILMNTFQAIPELSFSHEIKNCMNMKEKKITLLELLRKTEKTKQNSVTSQLADLSFDPLLPAFRPFPGDARYIESKITLKQYLSMLQKQPDVSEFIILTIGFLRSEKAADSVFLQKLSVDYLFVKYDDCLSAIKKHFEKLPEEKGKLILESLSKLRKFNPRHNDPRRFFETRLSQYINGLTLSKEQLLSAVKNKTSERYNDEKLSEETLQAVNKILIFFLGESGFADTPESIEKNISLFAQGYKYSSKFSKTEIEEIKSLRKNEEIIFFKAWDRVPKDQCTQILERKHESTPDKVGADTWNSSGGAMKGNSPVFSDFRCGPVRNMLVDSSQVAEKTRDSKGWFWNNDRIYAAYVGSVSGHTCEIVAMLHLYMNAHSKEISLQRDIQLFLTQLIAVYVKRGYHSLLEILDVLHDPVVQKLFKKNNVTIDLYQYLNNQEATGWLEYAMNDTLHYTQVLINKRNIKTQLNTHPFFTPAKKVELDWNWSIRCKL